MAEPKDKELSTNSEVKRSDDFQKEVEIKGNVIELAKELLESTTENEFSKLGYEKVGKSAGVYGNEKPYGAGTEQNKFGIRVAGKTKSSLEKQVMLGTKRIQSDINFEFNGKMVNVEYKTTEAGFFRGVDAGSISYAFIKTITLDGSNKSELNKGMKELFVEGAQKEIGYLTNTKLGVDDKTDKSTTSIVNENEQSMKKLTLKSIFSNEDILDSISESKIKDNNTDSVKNANTIPLSKTHPYNKGEKKADKNKFLFLDKNEEEIKEEKEAPLQEDGGPGVTSTGPSGSGAGAYLTPFAFKATSYGQYKNKRKPKVTKEYKVVPNSEGYNNDGFWQKVDVNALQGTHPLGMPGIKPNSKEEWDATVNGDKNKLKRLGLKESEQKITESPKIKPDLTKKKIFSEADNISKGINKRYLVTEKTSEEYLKERWQKLSNFKIFESIKENEEILNECSCDSNIESIKNKPELIDLNISVEETPIENVKSELATNLEETVSVIKPGSLFGIEYTFYKKDFLDENKKYILDLTSRVFVPNPNIK